MKKKLYLFKNISVFALLLVLVNMSFFAINDMPSQITDIADKSPFSIVTSLLFNLIFLILQSLVLAVFFETKTDILSEPFDKKIFLKKIAFLLTIPIIADLLYFVLQPLLAEYAHVLYDLFLIVKWFAFYTVLTSKQSQTIFTSKELKIVLGILVSVIITLAIVIDLKDVSVLSYWSGKFENQSDLLPIKTNIDFLFYLRSIIFDCVLGIVFYILHLLSQIKASRKAFAPRSFALAFILGFLLFLVFFLKGVIAPQGFLGKFELSPIYSTHLEKKFFADNKDVTFTRLDSDKKQNDVYNSTKYYITYANKTIRKFKLTVPNSYSIELGDNKMVFCNNAICYLKNDKPMVILFDEIAKHKKDNKLTEICERLILDGNLNAFDYSLDYLYKYDYDFIKPHVERIADEDFTEAELQFLKDNNFRKDFYTDLADDFSNNVFCN